MRFLCCRIICYLSFRLRLKSTGSGRSVEAAAWRHLLGPCDVFLFMTMASWKDHVRAQLQQRDQAEKVPFVGVFTSCEMHYCFCFSPRHDRCLSLRTCACFLLVSRLEERFEIRQQIVDDVQSRSLETGGFEVGKNNRLLQLQLRESEHLEEKLSQTVSDLTAVLSLKDAELQHWQSRVSRFRREALTLAKGNNTLRATLSEVEYTAERQSKELAALHAEQKALHQAWAQTWGEKEELLRRWLQEKGEVADRLNKRNETQERWQRSAKPPKKHLHKERRREKVPMVTSSRSGDTETPSSVIQSENRQLFPNEINSTKDRPQGHADHGRVSEAGQV
ncbi:autophagy-related protein 16-1 isoform 2-T2 [Spinachia spinachia]